MAPASRSCTTSCSTCAARSASSRRSATPGPRPTSSPPSTTRRAPRAASRRARRAPRSCSGCGRARARSGRCCRSTRTRSSRSTCAATTSSISSSSAWAHGVLLDPGAVHVCYCHNPFRYAWSEREATLAARSAAACACRSRCVLSRWRQWDWIAAQRVDRYVANSRLTAARVRRYFGREADVLHPPVELERFSPGRGRRALPGGRRADGAQADRRRDRGLQPRCGLPLVVVGDGPEVRRLRRLAGPTVRLTGRLTDAEVAELLRSAQALVVTAAEEFGIAAVESLASGRPVIALRLRRRAGERARGRDGRLLPARATRRALADVVAGFDPMAIDPAACVAAARRFGTDRFQAALRAIVAEAVAAESAARPRAPGGRHRAAAAPRGAPRRRRALKCALRHTRRRSAAKCRRLRFTSSLAPKTCDQRAENRVTCGGAMGSL